MAIGKYDSVKDMFDGGGPGKSGGAFSGGGNLSKAANAVSGRGGSSNSTKDDPARQQSISDRQDFQLDSYLNNSGDFNRGAFEKYIDPTYRDRQPTATAGPDGATTNAAVKMLGAINPLAGLAAATVSKLIGAGILDRKYGTGGASPTGIDRQRDNEFDAMVNSIVDDPQLSADQKKKAVADLAKQKATQTGVNDATDVQQQMVNTLATNAFKGQNPQNIFDNPANFLESMQLASQVTPMDPNAAGTVMSDVAYDPSQSNAYTPQTAQALQAGNIQQQQAQGYNAAVTLNDVMSMAQAEAAQGTVSDQAQMTPEQISQQGTATGTNPDGTVNYTGLAVNTAAQQKFGSIIDTSTPAGKMLAAELGEGNYTDAKATMQGQMEILSKQFVGPDGEPRVPSWAAGTARNVSRIAAFKGMTGTAATAALGQAIMEASIPMAQADAQFFQTLTVENLNNRQEQTLNKANVLARLDLANLDARTTAAVTNAQAFLQMDMANLDNRQQTEIINTQARFQSILEDAKAENSSRMFSAESANDFAKFYGQMEQQIAMFNTEQVNGMAQFNTGEINDAQQFNSQLDQQREQFYTEMQYNVDLANARWRQSVETVNTSMKFEAARADVQNMFSMSQEGLNRLWDREDAVLDYTWKTVTGEQDRDLKIYEIDRTADLAKRRLKNEEDMADGAAWGEVLTQGVKLLGGIFK